MQNRVAVLDVGSNSVRLMVADREEGKTCPVCRRTVTTRLMEAVVDGQMTLEGMMRAANAMRMLRREAEELGAEEICAFGTSAMRDAKNSHLLSQLAGIDIEVMAGDMEARLAYMGAAPRGRCGILDIGGGSTELIVGRDGEAERFVSIDAGAVRMNIRWGRLGREELLSRAEEALRPKAAPFAGMGVEKWIGVGGTITTLAAMTRGVNKYSPGAIESCPLTPGAVQAWYDRLMAMTVEERKGIVGLSPNRADIIHCGAALFLAALRVTGATVVFASDHDNLEGYIAWRARKTIDGIR